eukprot:CAMPEP_0198124562 /NCGR_PEP_ID=MMETSP1442-20131203/40219_1 /TAXON_ID= /ORGANISM="Craspedostauros australis, Strain CCMP3328" /LENGTH=171 /DNA_ID=CAMNT_0043783991 /DNA_START=58 /DNA_END=573 /DNA_ORIENTATION=+
MTAPQGGESSERRAMPATNGAPPAQHPNQGGAPDDRSYQGGNREAAQSVVSATDLLDFGNAAGAGGFDETASYPGQGGGAAVNQFSDTMSLPGGAMVPSYGPTTTAYPGAPQPGQLYGAPPPQQQQQQPPPQAQGYGQANPYGASFQAQPPQAQAPVANPYQQGYGAQQTF